MTHDGVTSMQVACPALTDSQAQRLDEWIRTALWDGVALTGTDKLSPANQVEILRCKGIYVLKTGEQFVLQGVRSMYEIVPLANKEPEHGISDEGKLVFIGRGLGQVVRQSLLDIILV